MLHKIFGYKVELIEHSPEYTLVRAEKPVKVGTQIPVRVSGANGRRTPAVPMIVVSCRPGEHGGYLVTGRFLVEHPDLSGFEIPPGMGTDSSLRADPRIDCHLCVISRDLPGYRAMTIDISEGGLQVEAPARVALGNSVLLRIEFDTAKLPALEATATVAWCSKVERGRYRIGLQFKSLDEKGGELIGMYRELLERRSKTSLSVRAIKQDDEIVQAGNFEESAFPSLNVLEWHRVPLFSHATLVGYRRSGAGVQVRLRGGETGVRYREYSFATLRGMQDLIVGDPTIQSISEFRFAETDDGYYRFQLLGAEMTPLLEIEAKSCSEQSAEQN